MLGPDYFKEKPETTYLNAAQLTPAQRKCLARYKRMHVPPTREQSIPVCQSGGLNRDPPQRQKFHDYYKNKRTSTPPPPVGNSTALPISDSDQPSSSKSGDAATRTKICKFLKPEWSPELCEKRDCPSWTGPDGVRITEITGFEDPCEPFEPITIMNRKVTPEITRRHPRHAIKRNAMYFVRIVNIIDPFRFYMEFITKPPSDENVSWEESLQRFYNEPGVAEKHKLRTLRPYIGQMYAVYNEELQKWERIRVHAIGKGTVCGMYLDRLQSFNRIPANCLHELHPNYGNWPKHPLSATLLDVRPIGYIPGEDDHKTHFDWPQEAIDYFKDSVKDKLFRAFIVSKNTDRTDNLLHASDEDRFCQVSVYLFEVGAKHMIPLNAWMVHKGYAVSIKSLDGCHELMEILHGVKPGDPDE